MATGSFEYYDHEREAIMALFLLAGDLLDLKKTKAPVKNPVSGKNHLYFETRDHKKLVNKREGY